MPVPHITSAATASGTVNRPFIYYITADDSPEYGSYSASGAPAWITVRNDGALLGTPTDAGTFPIVLQAGNASGTSPEMTLVLTIAPVAGSPAITSAASASGTVGVAFSYQATATNAPTGYSLTITALGQTVAASVPGLTFDAATGLLSGTPTTARTYLLDLNASNASGAGTPLSLTVVIAGASGGGTGTGTGTGTRTGTGTGTGTGGTGGTVTATPTTTPPGDGTGTGPGYNTGNGTVVDFIGRLILGQDLDGTYVSSGAVVTEMLTYAIGAGAPFQIGPVNGVTRCSSTVARGTLIPLDEVKDVTCAEVFRKMARWMPDCVSWFDYATAPPTLHFQPGGTGGTATLTLGASPLVSVGELTPRNDLQAPAVVIHYEQTGNANGMATLNLVTDSAVVPGTAIPVNPTSGVADPGLIFGAVVLTIPLRGQSSTSIQQRVYTVPIQDTIPSGDDSDDTRLIAYLAGRSADLAADVDNPAITAAGITITACSRTLKDPSADAYNAATGEYGAQAGYDDSLGYELVEGSISDWMASQYNLQDQEQVITFTYTADSGSGDSNDASGANYQGVSDPKMVSFPLRATNAAAQVYTALTNYNAGDTVPTGLALYYLSTVSALPWSGSVVLTEQTAGAKVPAAALGNFLNIAGSANAAWASMNALIVGEAVQASTGRTTLTLGPPMHLSPQDLVARLTITRPGGTGGRHDTGAQGTANSDTRQTGQPGGNNTVPGATKFPIKTGGTLLNAAAAASAPLPLTILDASAKDASGTAHPGRVRVLAGFLGGLLPTEMKVPDTLLPNGTDNRCYLTMQNGYNYIYGKVTVGSGGLFTSADVYLATGTVSPDSSYAYLAIGVVVFDGTKLTITQLANGSQSLLVYPAGNGSGAPLQAAWLGLNN